MKSKGHREEIGYCIRHLCNIVGELIVRLHASFSSTYDKYRSAEHSSPIRRLHPLILKHERTSQKSSVEVTGPHAPGRLKLNASRTGKLILGYLDRNCLDVRLSQVMKLIAKQN